mmetsp:Transcript_103288/g.274722  ORF Transcript_103288/g.274722 Transcript_103288/m.274722 type:complete len:211 (-) Transcript_103288:107-739(-)
MTSHSFKHCSMDWTKASSSSSSSPSALVTLPPLAMAAAAATAAAEGPSPVPYFAPPSKCAFCLVSLPSSSWFGASAAAPCAAGAGAAPMAPALAAPVAGPAFLPFRMSRASSSEMCCSRLAALNSFAPPPFLSSTCHRDLCSSNEVSTPSRPLSSGRACSPQTFTFMPIFSGSSDFTGGGAASAAGAAAGLSAPAAGDPPAVLAALPGPS